MTRPLRCLRITFRRYNRRMSSALLLLVFAVTAAGVPLPAGNKSQKSGELYPCATCKCGCASAEQCWKSCCCHTLSERLAWAREHGVTPPAFALAEARHVGLLDTLASKTCCAKGVATPVPSCCQKKLLASPAAEHTCCHKHTATSTTNGTNQHIVAWRVLSCRGQALSWLAAVPALVVVRLAWSHQHPCVAWLGPAASEQGAGISDAPVVPPPEWA
jgi:hypothetical protein